MPRLRPIDCPRYDGPDAAAILGGDLGAYEGRALGDAAGFTRLGANVETLMPGSASSHRHWHEATDELVVVLDGQLVLDEDDATTELEPGDIAVFPAGRPLGHRLVNRSHRPARFLVVGSRDAADRCHYTQFDAILNADGQLTRADGHAIQTRTERSDT